MTACKVRMDSCRWKLDGSVDLGGDYDWIGEVLDASSVRSGKVPKVERGITEVNVSVLVDLRYSPESLWSVTYHGHGIVT
jgi:hypothetical protein